VSAGGQQRSSPAADSVPAAYARGPLYVLAALVFVTPLVTANLTALGPALPWLYDAVELPRFILSMLGALVACLLWTLRQVRDPLPLRWNWPLVGLASLAGLAAASAVFALDPRLGVLGQSERLEGIVTFAVYALLFGVTLQVVRDSRDVRTLAGALAATAAVSAAYGVVQWLGVDPTDHLVANPGFELRRAFATFGNPNFLAGLLVLALPPSAALASRRQSNASAVGLWAVTALIALALLLTFTRGALLGLLVEAVVFVWLLVSARIELRTSARWGTAAVASVLIGAAAVSVGRGGEVDLLARLLSRGGLTDRLLGWQAALEAALARPLLGYGPDGFLGAFRLYRPDAYAEIGGLAGTLNNAHSWPLQLAATVGIPAAIAFSLAVGYALWLGARAALARRGNGVGEPPSDDEGGAASAASTLPDPVFVGVWLGCLGYVVHMLGNVAVHGVTTPFWVMLAAVTVPACRVWAPSSKRSTGWRVLAAALVVLVAVAGMASLGLLAADSAYLSSRVAYREQTADPIEPAQRAVTLNPLSVKYDRGLAEVVADEYYRPQGDALDAATEQAEASAFARADERFRDMLGRYPNDYAGHAWHAALLASAGKEAGSASGELAIEAATRAEALDRHAVQVMPIAEGDLARPAILKALSVPGLP
jgi:O-antigen ligase